MLAILMTSAHDRGSWPLPQTGKGVDIRGSGSKKTPCGARLPVVRKFLVLSENIYLVFKILMIHEDTSGTYLEVLS